MTTLKNAVQNALLKAFVSRALTDWLKSLKGDKQLNGFLTGYKTYIVAAIMLLLIVLHQFGINVPGVDPMTLDIGAAIGLLFSRSGAKSDVKNLAKFGTVPGDANKTGL